MGLYVSEFLSLFNEIIALESRGRATPAQSMDVFLLELDLDSMEHLVLGITYCTFYGVSDAIAKQYVSRETTTIADFKQFLDDNSTKEPPSREECLAIYKDTCF